MRQMTRGGIAAVMAGVLVVGLGACGGDDDDADAGAEPGAANDGELAADESAGSAEFCEAVVAVDEVNMGLDAGTTTPEDFDAALTAAEEAAPDDVADSVATAASETRSMMAAMETAAPDGPPPMPGDAFYPAAVEVGGYATDNCDLEAVDVTATEYAFDGIAGTVPPGPAIINFTNEGEEYHEIVLMKVAEGEERPVEELMTLPDAEVQALVTEVAFVMAPPGAGNYTTADLEAGRYVALCFVPVGMTPEALESGAVAEGDGHMMHGMVTEFEVA